MERKDTETPNPEFEAKGDKIAANNFYTIRAKFYDMFRIKGDFGDEDMIKMIFKKLQSAIAEAEHEGELQTALDAWFSIFGTNQLTHAQARLEQAEKEAKKYKELMERVSGGVEKRNKQLDGTYLDYGDADIFNNGFNQAIDLCNAHWAEKMNKGNLAEFINKKYFGYFSQYDLKFGHNLAQALINHLTKGE